MVKLKKELVDKLVGLPETGRGYHLVDIKVDNHMWVHKVSVVNCEIIDGIDGLETEDITDVKLSKLK